MEYLQNAALSEESWRKFQALFFEAELIFSKETVAAMEGALGALFRHGYLLRRSTDYHHRGNLAKANEFLEKSFSEDDRAFELMPSLLDLMKAEAKISQI